MSILRTQTCPLGELLLLAAGTAGARSTQCPGGTLGVTQQLPAWEPGLEADSESRWFCGDTHGDDISCFSDERGVTSLVVKACRLLLFCGEPMEYCTLG
mmetsp:Transcript_24859/g.57738  ORF Transcript_24859/g.57738 Transcript_24859/m.57738 type:complete len:99 (+) Transcript_24859:83-379(+)